MGAFFDWINENFWLWMIIMVVVLGGLIGILIFVRKNQNAE